MSPSMRIATFRRSRHTHIEEVYVEDPGAPKFVETNIYDDVVLEEHVLEDHDMEKPQRLVDPP